MIPKYSRANCVAITKITVGKASMLALAATFLIALTGCPPQDNPTDDPILSVSPGSVSVSANPGIATLTITNVGGGTLVWSAQVISGSGWLAFVSSPSGTGNGQIVLSVLEHSSPGSRDAFDPRSGVVRVSTDSSTRDVTITQDGDLADYNVGFDDGFAEDADYFIGYDDSWLTQAFEVLWQGHLIDFIDDLSYDAGFFDGRFTAYSDGFFVAYRYAFIIGFSEGYDSAFAPDYLDFLANDIHVEYANGGFPDGYNDGFSEGRIFGAADYEALFEFDWLAAFFEWEDGIDLFFEEVGVGTGEFGPVILYEYGTDPLAVKSLQRKTIREGLTMRTTGAQKQGIEFSRPLTPEQEADLNVQPTTSTRSIRTLTLQTTWLERIQDFSGITKNTREPRTRTLRVAP